MSETKKEIKARIDELNLMIQHLDEMSEGCLTKIGHRINELEAELVLAPELPRKVGDRKSSPGS